MPRALCTVLLAALCAAACGDDTPTSPSTTTSAGRTTEVFQGRVAIGASQFYSFYSSVNGTTDVTLVSIGPAGSTTAPATTAMGLGLGTPSGTDCALSSTVTTSPGLTAQLSVATNVSTYCVKIADVGNLTGTVDYTVRILHP